MPDLTEAANILDTSEFEVLRRAHIYWYGQPASDTQLAPVFAAWLTEQKLPVWARHYVNQVIRDFEKQLGTPCRCLALLWMWLISARRSKPSCDSLLA